MFPGPGFVGFGCLDPLLDGVRHSLESSGRNKTLPDTCCRWGALHATSCCAIPQTLTKHMTRSDKQWSKKGTLSPSTFGFFTAETVLFVRCGLGKLTCPNAVRATPLQHNHNFQRDQFIYYRWRTLSWLTEGLSWLTEGLAMDRWGLWSSIGDCLAGSLVLNQLIWQRLAKRLVTTWLYFGLVTKRRRSSRLQKAQRL